MDNVTVQARAALAWEPGEDRTSVVCKKTPPSVDGSVWLDSSIWINHRR